MNGPEMDGAPTSGAGPPLPVLVGVALGVRVGVRVGVEVITGVCVGVLVGVCVGVRVGVPVTVGVCVGVLVGVCVGVRVGVLGATQAGSVLVASLQGPVALAQLEPVPQNT
jgi:hypothetical protein